MASTTTPATLAELVRRYRVCWEIGANMARWVARANKVGFELELLRSDESVGEYDPVCEKSLEIHATLEAVAEWIFEDDQQVRFQINRGEQSLCYSPVRGNRPDLTLWIKILHRAGVEKPVDESERKYLENTKARLHQLGACEHRWHSAAPEN